MRTVVIIQLCGSRDEKSALLLFMGLGLPRAHTDPYGGCEVLSMMAGNVSILFFFHPHLLKGAQICPRRHALWPPAVRCLISRDVFHAPTNSITFFDCNLSSVFLFEQFFCSLIFLILLHLYPQQFLVVPYIKDTAFSRIAYSMMQCVRLSVMSCPCSSQFLVTCFEEASHLLISSQRLFQY